MDRVRQVHVFDFSPGTYMHLDPSAFVADPELVTALQKQAAPIECAADRVLFRQGESATGLYILENGEVTLTMDSLAGESILSIETAAGSLLGLPALAGGQPYSLTAVARAGAKVSFVARDKFTAFMQSYPTLAFKILQVLAAEVSAARRAISI